MTYKRYKKKRLGQGVPNNSELLKFIQESQTYKPKGFLAGLTDEQREEAFKNTDDGTG